MIGPINKTWGMISGIQDRILNRITPINPAPILVLGNQKAGTTVIAALLAEAAGKTVTQDFFFRLPEEELKDLLLSQGSFPAFVGRHRVPFSREIIKDNSLTFLLPELKSIFPQRSVCFIQRDPRDNIRSILNRLRVPGDLSELNSAHRNEKEWNVLWKWLLDGQWPSVPGENYVQRMAHRWNLAAEVYLRNREEMELLRYEDFCADKIRTIIGLAEGLGFPATGDISRLVSHQFQPAGDNTMDWRRFFGDENLCSIENICAESMSSFGYNPTLC